MNFGNLGSLFSGDGPGMGDFMKIIGPLMGPGSTQDKIAGVVQKFATDENIREYTGNIISGLAALQAANNQKYLVYVEGTDDGKDIFIRLMRRLTSQTEVMMNGGATVVSIREIYLSRITQDDIISLINLFFKNGPGNTTEPKRIG